MHGQKQIALSGGQTGALYAVDKLAHIAWPGIFHKHVQHLPGNGLARQIIVQAEAAHGLLGQRGDLVPSLAQGRNDDGETLKAVQQIRAKRAIPGHDLDVFIGGSHKAKVAADLAHFTHGPEPFELKGAQKSALHGLGQVAHFVKKKRALVGRQQKPFPRPVSPGERATAVPEKVALHQGFRQGGAVHRHKRARSPRAVAVQGLGKNFLANPGFAQQKHVDLALRGLGQKLQGMAHAHARSQDMAAVHQEGFRPRNPVFAEGQHMA